MYYIKFYKRDEDYLYLFKGKNFIKKFLTWTSLYNYIRENNIDFKNVRFIKLDVYLLFYHLMNFTDMEEHFKLYSKNKFDCKYNSSSFNEKNRI